MDNRFNFTKGDIAKLPAAKPGKRSRYLDEKVRGLALMVTDAGSKSFYWVRWVGNKAEQVKLGRFPDMTVELARKTAEDHNHRIAKGENPAQEKRDIRADPTFGELFDWWLQRPVKRKRSDRYQGELLRQRDGHLAGLVSKKASLVTKADVRRLHEAVGQEAPYMANRLLSTIRAVFNKGIAHEKVTCANPAIGIEAFPEEERERRLLPGDIGKFLEAVVADEDQDTRDIVLLALFTGARRTHLLSMRWDCVDLENRTWKGLVKRGREVVLPLGDHEVEILRRRKTGQGRSPFVFPGTGSSGHMEDPKKGWDRIRKAAGMEDLRFHDLRRTLGSFMADAWVPENIIGRGLTHLSPQATKIYARLAIDPVRKGKDAGVAKMLESTAWPPVAKGGAATGSEPQDGAEPVTQIADDELDIR